MSVRHTRLLLIERESGAECSPILLLIRRLLLGKLVPMQVDSFHVLPLRFVTAVVAAASGIFTHEDVYFSEKL